MKPQKKESKFEKRRWDKPKKKPKYPWVQMTLDDFIPDIQGAPKPIGKVKGK